MRRFFVAGSVLAGASLASAQPLSVPLPVAGQAQTAQGDLSVTIYNKDRALVEDRRN